MTYMKVNPRCTEPGHITQRIDTAELQRLIRESMAPSQRPTIEFAILPEERPKPSEEP